jgi:hypothetical protein
VNQPLLFHSKLNDAVGFGGFWRGVGLSLLRSVEQQHPNDSNSAGYDSEEYPLAFHY